MDGLAVSIGRHWRRAAGAALRAGLDFLYPPQCAFCGIEDTAVAAADDGEPRLCGRCRRELAPWIEFSCLRCGAPVGPHLETSAGCIHCRDDRFAFERVIRLGVYGGALRQACLRAKRDDGDALAAELARLLWMWEGVELVRERIDLVAHVPHHWRTRLRRAHNPAESLAAVLAGRLKVRHVRHRLMKVRHTRPQTDLTATERRRNLRGAFRVRGAKSLTGRRVLLVDDVLTTGSTAHEAATALRRAGAAGVVVVVIARGVGR